MQTITYEDPAPRVRVATKELLFALHAVLPHASTEKNLPHLSAVWFETVGNQLYLVATDRYTLGAYAIDRISEDEIDLGAGAKFTAHLELPDARRLLVWLKHMPRDTFLNLLADGYEGALAVGDTDENSLLVLPVHQGGGYINWKADVREAVIPMYGEEDLTEPLAFDTGDVARFGAARADKRTPMVIYPGEAKKARLVLVGDRFIGLIQPVDRGPLSAQEFPAWTALDWKPGQEPPPHLSVVGDGDAS